MAKNRRTNNPDFLEKFYNQKELTDQRGLDKYYVLPTKKLNVKRLNDLETEVGWEYVGLFCEPYLRITKDKENDSYSYAKKGLLRYVLINYSLIPVMTVYYIITDGSSGIFKFVLITSLFWLPFLVSMGKLVQRLIIKEVEKQIGKIVNIE